MVLSPDGTHAYVSAYVSDTVTALRRIGDRFQVSGTLAVGRRPAGMSVTPDGTTLMVAHFLPRGELDANEGWVSLVDTASFTVAGETELVDDSNTTPSGCLTQIQGFAQYQPSDLGVEGVPTQLAGISSTLPERRCGFPRCVPVGCRSSRGTQAPSDSPSPR